jgi:hypothetical protein
MRFRKSLAAAAVLSLLCISRPLFAQGVGGFFQSLDWSVRGSILVFPEDNGADSAPMPILPSLGGGVSYALSDLLALEATLDLYGTTYDYAYNLERAIPANDEFRSAFVIGALLGFQPVFRFRPAGDKFTVRAYGGLGFDLRIVLRAYGIEDSEAHTNNNVNKTGHTVGEARSDINSYFWGSGRFIFPFVGGGMDFPLTEGIELGFDLRAWVPVWRLWSGEDLPFIDSFRFGLGFRVTFR